MDRSSQGLHVNGGTGETSYANNSLVQRKVLSMTMPIIVEAITSLYCSTSPRSLAIADFGCASGPNTLFVVSEIIKIMDKLRQELGHHSPEYQVFLNDLPGNDFNSIFKSLPNFQRELSYQLGSGAGPRFFSGVPGTFYGRLFPSKSLHFVHSSYSLHWLSQVPGKLENNKGYIYMASTSPPDVLRAYHAQFQRDFSMFLKCRAEELVAGGRTVLTILGRRSEDPSSKECCHIWDLLAMALNDMVSKGLITEEKMDSLNVPTYSPPPTEVKSEVLKEGSFSIDRLQVSEIDLLGYDVANLMRAAVEPMLVRQFGDAIIEEVFSRYKEILSDCIPKETPRFFNVTISATKRA